MRIIGFDIQELHIGLKKPFITALRRVDKVEDLIIKIITDTSLVGYSEACAVTAITGSTNEMVRHDLETILFPLLLNKELNNTSLLTLIQDTSSCAEAKACLDIGVYDLLAKEQNQSLHTYLGATTSSLQTDLTISVNTPEVMKEDTKQALILGFKVLKIKLDKDISQNISRLKAINSVLPKDIKLRLDPNQALTLESCLEMFQHIKLDNLECIEQPFDAKDIQSMKALKDKDLVPVLADESLFNLVDTKLLLDKEAIDLLNIKLMKSGGIFEAFKIAKMAKEYKKDCMIGSMLEGPICLLAAVHFGLSQDNVIMADLDSPLYLKEHPLLKPFNLIKDTINLGNELGLGIDQIMSSYFVQEQ